MGTLTTDQLIARLSSDSEGMASAEPSDADLELYEEACTNAEAIVCSYIGNGKRFQFGTDGTAEEPVTRRMTADGTATLLLTQPLRAFAYAANDGQLIVPGDAWLEANDDDVITALVLENGRWSSRRQAVTVTGVWGWGDAPPEIVEVMLELAVRIVKGRSAGYSDVIGVGTDGTQQYTKALPQLAKLVLDLARQRYRMPDTPASGGWFGVA